jgi:hypothetical protein
MSELKPVTVLDEVVASKLYETYCQAVGGKAYNGDPLPSWREFASDANKKKQVAAWHEVARQALTIKEELTYAEDRTTSSK